MKTNTVKYGQYITVNNKKMYVSVSGINEKVILLLPGLGSVCPIIEMKALTHYLKSTYTVVTVEYFGYGMSENASTERTTENIADDIHEAMNVLGYKKYAVAGHSIAGIYGLRYTHKYADEVTHFIGLDSSVPQQIHVFKNQIDTMLNKKLKIYESRNSWLISAFTRISAVKFIKNADGYSYSREDIRAYCNMAVKALKHGSVINELQNAEKNFSALANTTFPEKMKVLLMLASETCERIPNWEKWHKELLNEIGKVEIINGSHYFHLRQPEVTAERIKNFISEAK